LGDQTYSLSSGTWGFSTGENISPHWIGTISQSSPLRTAKFERPPYPVKFRGSFAYSRKCFFFERTKAASTPRTPRQLKSVVMLVIVGIVVIKILLFFVQN
jgi:hypothetical protein